MRKVAEVNLIFWIMKICATTVGETGGDMLSMTFDIGYGLSSIILFGAFIVSLILQLNAKSYHPVLYWLVILTTSTAGTTMSDYMDRTLGIGYAAGSLILIFMLVSVLFIWHKSEKTLSVTNIKTFRPELFYWIAILFSNTLGTALGDFLADDSGLGFAGGAFLIGAFILIIVILKYTTSLSTVLLFWAAFVLTRPFGATFGDFLTKPTEIGGLNLGTIGSTVVLLSILLALLVYSIIQQRKIKSI